MSMSTENFKELLCKAFCTEVNLYEKGDNLLFVETPFTFGDGDTYSIFLKQLSSGGVRITDCGHTMMHLSYENDIDKFREGTRGKIFEQILNEMELKEENGAFYMDTPTEQIGSAIFRFGQAVTKIHDLTFLNRFRAEATFYEDLKESLLGIVSSEKLVANYVYETMPNARDYPIDFRIEGKYAPLFVFGIPGRDKARLATIILEHLLRENAEFDSILVFADQSIIPRGDLARLSNVGGEMVASLDAQDDMQRKILKRIAA